MVINSFQHKSSNLSKLFPRIQTAIDQFEEKEANKFVGAYEMEFPGVAVSLPNTLKNNNKNKMDKIVDEEPSPVCHTVI